MNFVLFNSLRDPRLMNPKPYCDLREDGASDEARFQEKFKLAKHALNLVNVQKAKKEAEKKRLEDERREEQARASNVYLLQKQGN